MKAYKYVEDRREGEIFYILQVSEESGIYEAMFKGYPNYKNNTFILYPHKILIIGVEGFEKKIIDFDEVLYKQEQ